jgi:hypothetical protein
VSARGVVNPPRRPALARAWNWWRTLLAVRRRYAQLFGRQPRLILARRHSERIVQRKLFRRDPRMPLLADKIEVKAFVAGRIGPRFVVPTIWAGDAVPSRQVMRSWPRPFVLKGAHGSGWTVLVPAEGPVNWARIERRAQRWLDTTYAERAGEWLYTQIPHRLVVEPHLGDPAGRPDDYKLWVFQGRVHYVNWIEGRGSPSYGGRVLDRDWNEAFTNRSMPTAPDLPPRPESLETMIWMAERLGQDFDFVRVDLYEIGGRPLVGELTFYPMSGYLPVHPTDTDLELGRLWRRPRRERFPATPAPDRQPAPPRPEPTLVAAGAPRT